MADPTTRLGFLDDLFDSLSTMATGGGELYNVERSKRDYPGMGFNQSETGGGPQGKDPVKYPVYEQSGHHIVNSEAAAKYLQDAIPADIRKIIPPEWISKAVQAGGQGVEKLEDLYTLGETLSDPNMKRDRDMDLVANAVGSMAGAENGKVRDAARSRGVDIMNAYGSGELSQQDAIDAAMRSSSATGSWDAPREEKNGAGSFLRDLFSRDQRFELDTPPDTAGFIRG